MSCCLHSYVSHRHVRWGYPPVLYMFVSYNMSACFIDYFPMSSTVIIFILTLRQEQSSKNTTRWTNTQYIIYTDKYWIYTVHSIWFDVCISNIYICIYIYTHLYNIHRIWCIHNMTTIITTTNDSNKNNTHNKNHTSATPSYRPRRSTARWRAQRRSRRRTGTSWRSTAAAPRLGGKTHKKMVNQWENHRKTMGKWRFTLW